MNFIYISENINFVSKISSIRQRGKKGENSHLMIIYENTNGKDFVKFEDISGKIYNVILNETENDSMSSITYDETIKTHKYLLKIKYRRYHSHNGKTFYDKIIYHGPSLTKDKNNEDENYNNYL